MRKFTSALVYYNNLEKEYVVPVISVGFFITLHRVGIIKLKDASFHYQSITMDVV